MPTRRSVPPKKVEPAPKKRQRADWQAVERDYRTGLMTLRELAEKHGCSHQAISKRAGKHEWAQDLSPAIRAATAAKLVQHEVAKEVAKEVASEVAKGGQEVINAVLVAAELNKQVILSHRSRLRQLQADADMVRNKLLQMTEEVSDVREASTLVSAFESSARTTKIVIEAERKAFGLDAMAEQEAPDSERNRVTVEFINPVQS
jgi:hypothetical protein